MGSRGSPTPDLGEADPAGPLGCLHPHPGCRKHQRQRTETENRPPTAHIQMQVPAGQREGRMAALCEKKQAGCTIKRMGANQRYTL